MIGSEGTLGFISEITYHTVPEYADKASALMLFPSAVDACAAIVRLKRAPVAAAELMDRASLRSVEDKPGMPAFIRGLPEGATALLIETRAESRDRLAANIVEIDASVAGLPMLLPAAFTDVPAEYERLWNIRKGLFPSVGGMRETGTTVIIEDVAFPIESLAPATARLQELLDEFGYRQAILFGHALEGNLHFVFTQDFGNASEIDRYRRFMDAVCEMVVDRYDGSLKAEHGTGRNMAPFVELEWGARAYEIMREIKQIFDPRGLLNPGVILNDDPQAHLKNLKPLPAADPVVDKCMECGFCVRMCPSEGMTFTPRHRIIGWREISRLRAVGDEAGAAAMSASYDYQGLETCAACGLCAIACPVSIETGILTKKLRGERMGPLAHRMAELIADNYAPVLAATRQGLRLADLTGKALGAETLESVSRRSASLERRPGAHLNAGDADGGVVPAVGRRRLRSAGSGHGVFAELRRAHHGPGARRSGAAVVACEDRGAVAQGRLARGLSEEPERLVLRPTVRKQGPRRNREHEDQGGRRGSGGGERGRAAADRLRHQPLLVSPEASVTRASASPRHRRVHSRRADEPPALHQATGGGGGAPHLQRPQDGPGREVAGDR
jgi:D-lactate dehydrogenase